MFLLTYAVILVLSMHFELSLSGLFDKNCCTKCPRSLNGHKEFSEHEVERKCLFEPLSGVTGGPLFYEEDENMMSEDACKSACVEDLNCDIVTTLPTAGTYSCRYYKDEHLQVAVTNDPYTFWRKRCPNDFTECSLVQPDLVQDKSLYGGKCYYRKVTVNNAVDCQEICKSQHVCAAVSFITRKFGRNRCLLYRKGKFKVAHKPCSNLWIKECPRHTCTTQFLPHFTGGPLYYDKLKAQSEVWCAKLCDDAPTCDFATFDDRICYLYHKDLLIVSSLEGSTLITRRCPDICTLDIGPGVGVFGGTNQPYSVQLADSIYSCRGYCLRDMLCVFVAYRHEEDHNRCYLYGNDFELSLIEPHVNSFLFHKKCPHAIECERETLFGYHAGDAYFESKNVLMQSGCPEFCREHFCEVVASVRRPEGGFECRLYRTGDVEQLVPSGGAWLQVYSCRDDLCQPTTLPGVWGGDKYYNTYSGQIVEDCIRACRCSAQSRNRYNSGIVLRKVGILTLLRKVGILTLRKTIPELSLRKVRIGTK